MSKKHPAELKESILTRCQSGQRVADVAADTAVPRSTIYAWLKQASADTANRTVTEKTFRELERKKARLEGIIEIMKKVGCSAGDPLEIKLPALEALYGQYSVHEEQIQDTAKEGSGVLRRTGPQQITTVWICGFGS